MKFIEEIKLAVLTANQSYIARTDKPNLDKSGINPDLSRALKALQDFSPEMIKVLQTLDVTASKICKLLTSNTNIKKTLRIIQFLGFLASNDKRYLKGSSKTALLTFASMLCLTRNKGGLVSTVSLKRLDMLQDLDWDCPHQFKAQQLVRALNDGNLIKYITLKTQLSVSVSKDGILSGLGICEVMKTSSDEVVINLQNPITRMLIALVENNTSETFHMWNN